MIVVYYVTVCRRYSTVMRFSNYTAAEIESANAMLLQICYRTLTNTRNSETKSQQNIKALQNFLPQKFLQNFRNSCWYSSLRISTNLSRHFRTINAVRRPIFDTTMTKKLVDDVSRTIFKHHHKKLLCMPSLYLAAFPKCGTTALYHFLIHHPMVAAPIRKEKTLLVHFYRRWCLL